MPEEEEEKKKNIKCMENLTKLFKSRSAGSCCRTKKDTH
jgi:hypothetical protein